MKQGSVVTVTFDIKVEKGEAYTRLGTLPEGWRPQGYLVQPAFFSEPSSSIPYCDIKENGTVSVSPLGSGGNVYCVITYLATS